MLPSTLILATLALLSQSALAEEWLGCDPPKSFQVELENGSKVQIYDAEIKVKYDRNDLAVYDYPDNADVNILINNTIVTFSGYIQPGDDEPVQFNVFAPKVTRTFKSQIVGSAILAQDHQSNDLSLTDCDIYLSWRYNEELSSNIPKNAQLEIINEATNCVKETIFCQRLGSLTAADMRRARTHPFDFGGLSVLARGRLADLANTLYRTGGESGGEDKSVGDVRTLLWNFRGGPTSTNSSMTSGLAAGQQSTINELVDLAIGGLVRRINEENHGTITIPNLSQSFSTGYSWWATTGEFNATDGTFRDLTTLKRTEDSHLKRDGLKFTISSGFGLSIANMEYLSYRLRYGIVKVNGRVSGSIDGLSVRAATSVDYNVKPCRAKLEELRVDRLDKIRVKLTGLGPLNKLLSRLVTWITKKWQGEIVELVERELSGLIVKNLGRLDCEKYRP